jgi:hypothetical protein
MNRRGIFCFLLLLAFFSLEIGLLNQTSEPAAKLGEARALAFEAEKASLVRALMENSVDATIEESLRQGLLLNQEPKDIKKTVNNRLASLFGKMQKEFNEEVKVFFDPNSLDEEYLNENSSVLVTRLDKKTVKAEYCFTGGLMKNNEVIAEIRGGSAKLLFKMPAGYTIGKTVIG